MGLLTCKIPSPIWSYYERLIQSIYGSPRWTESPCRDSCYFYLRFIEYASLMAARKRKYQTEKTREKIKATALANRLQQFVLNEKDNWGNEVLMTTAQVQAAKTLLDRVVPVLRENDNLERVEEKTPAEMFAEVVEKVGQENANKMFPEIAAKLQNHQSDTVQ